MGIPHAPRREDHAPTPAEYERDGGSRAVRSEREGILMKTRMTTTTLAMALTLGAALPRASAGDREWAVAGKVLTGIAAATVVSRLLDPAPCAGTTAVVYQQPPVYVVTPPPAPVVLAPAPGVAQAPVCPPAPVAYATPAPTVVYATPAVVVSGPPVHVAPVPVVVTAPVFVHRPHRSHWGFHGHVVFRP